MVSDAEQFKHVKAKGNNVVGHRIGILDGA
jgi:hypothetical protein